jgi:RNA polymerase sigma-70 factor (ECF subfamily)
MFYMRFNYELRPSSSTTIALLFASTRRPFKRLHFSLMQLFSEQTVLMKWNCETGAKKEPDTLTTEPREQIERFLPLSPERAERFVKEWEGFVLSCIRRMRIVDEEDVLYRIFYKALNALPDFRRDSKISTWLYKITWREGLRHIQKQKVSSQKEAPILEADDQPDPGESVLEVLERRETADHVQWALSKLPVKYREVLALKYLEELQTAELADRLNIPVGTVKARIHRALAKLKELLEKHHD